MEHKQDVEQPPPPYEGEGVNLGSSMSSVPNMVYFQQPSAADIDRMTMFQIVDDQGRLLFTCTLNRIPRALVGTRARSFKSEYTLTDNNGRTVLVALSDGNNISVNGGGSGSDRATIGFIDGGNYSTALQWLMESSAVYTGTIANGVSTFRVQRTGSRSGPGAPSEYEFVVEQTGQGQATSAAVGVMKRGLPNCPEAYARNFGIKLEPQSNTQTQALILATGLNVYDCYFMLTRFGDGGLRGVQLAWLKRVAVFALVGFIVVVAVFIFGLIMTLT